MKFVGQFLVGFLCGFLGLSAPTLAATPDAKRDPFARISVERLANGLLVYLAPNTKTNLMRMEVEVDVGMEAEEPGLYGVSHLLEHALFRHPDLSSDMSFAELIKEEGGSANGFTELRVTRYVAEVPAEKSEWLVRTYGKMLAHPKFTSDAVEKSAREVLLEIGEPSPFESLFGLAWGDLIDLPYLERPGFWQTEFNLEHDERLYTLTEERVSTLGLTEVDLATHYRAYYAPRNMRVFVAGNFHPGKILAWIEQSFGQLEDREGRQLPGLKGARLREKPFIRSRSSQDAPFIEVGLKVWNIDFVDGSVVAAYLRYLAHRAMKKIRNEAGNTYSVVPEFNLRDTLGFMGVSLEASTEAFREIRDYLLATLRREAIDGQITDDEIEEAKRLYLKEFELSDHSSEDLVGFARQLHMARETYKSSENPYSGVARLTPAEFRERLRRSFKPERLYQYLEWPPLVFQGDWVLIVLALIGCIYGAGRFVLLKPFDHLGLRWVRKVKYPPALLAEATLVGVTLLLTRHLLHLPKLAMDGWTWLQSLPMAVDYVYLLIDVLTFGACFFLIFSLFPRKLLVVGGDLVVKSMTFFARRFPLSSIARMEALTPFQMTLRPHLWRRIGHRFHYNDPFFWRKGLYLEIQDGPAFFMSVTEAERALAEIESLRSGPAG